MKINADTTLEDIRAFHDVARWNLRKLRHTKGTGRVMRRPVPADFRRADGKQRVSRVNGRLTRASARKLLTSDPRVKALLKDFIDYSAGNHVATYSTTYEQQRTLVKAVTKVLHSQDPSLSMDSLLASLPTHRAPVGICCNSEELTVYGFDTADVVRLHAVDPAAAWRLAPLANRPLPLKETDCRDTTPVQSLERELKAVLFAGRANYDLTAAHLTVAVPADQMPDRQAIADEVGCSVEAVKSYCNLLIQGDEPTPYSWCSWTQAYGAHLIAPLSARLGYLRRFAKPAAELQRLVRDRMRLMMAGFRRFGFVVVHHEHDGLVLDREAPLTVINTVLAYAGFPEHAEFRLKPFV